MSSSPPPLSSPPSPSSLVVRILQDLIRIPTVSALGPTGPYIACSSFLLDLYSSLLPSIRKSSPKSSAFTIDTDPKSPVVVLNWVGSDPTLPVLLLNGHYDVVPPGDLSGWSCSPDPFSGVVSDGRVYGRGAQDMKSVLAQYYVAIKELAEGGHVPRRSIVLTSVPDEEVGGSGMSHFLSSPFYAGLSAPDGPGIGLALDEGLASEDDVYSVFYGERLPWWIDVTATGATGHGSRFIEPTAMSQIINFSKKALSFRQAQKSILHGCSPPSAAAGYGHEGCSHAVAARKKRSLGDVTTLNITSINAGVDSGNGRPAYNVVPPTARAVMDVRISPLVPPSSVADMLDGWCRECAEPGGTVSWTTVEKRQDEHHTTPTTAKANPYYAAFMEGLGLSGVEAEPKVFPAATDSRFLRALGVRALGFSPMRNSEILLHEYDENVKVEVLEEGVGVNVNLIRHLSGVVIEGEEGGNGSGKRKR